MPVAPVHPPLDGIDLAAQVDQRLQRTVVELLGDVAALLLLAEHDLAGVGLHEVVATGLGGDVLEDDLHPPIGPGAPTTVAVGRYSTAARRPRRPRVGPVVGGAPSVVDVLDRARP